MKVSRLVNIMCACISIPGLCTPVYAALDSRAGGLAVYDTDMNVTWVSNPQLGATESFGYANAGATMTFAGTLAWIDAMNSANYLGVNAWRLPTSEVTCGTNGCTTGDINTNEFQHLLDAELGGDIAGTDPDLALFGAFGRSTSYWTSSNPGPAYSSSWYLNFIFENGRWVPVTDNHDSYAMPLVDGDPLALPLLLGDVAPWDNPDGLINAADVLIAVQLALGQRTPGALQYAHGDMNTDGIIDLADLLLVTQAVFRP